MKTPVTPGSTSSAAWFKAIVCAALSILAAPCLAADGREKSEKPILDLVDGVSAAGPDSPQQAGRGGRPRSSGVYRDRISPHWFAGNTRFWYRNDLRDGGREFILVDAEKGTRRPAFDHEAVARAFGDDAAPGRLPIDEIRFGDDGGSVTLIGNSKSWILNLASGAVTEASPEPSPTPGLSAQGQPRPSRRTGPETEITFDNRLGRTVEIFWIDTEGARQSYGVVGPGTRKAQHTFGGHVWLVVGEGGETLAVFEAADQPDVAVIDNTRPAPGERERRGQRRGREGSDRSPDGQWTAVIRDHNLFLRSRDDQEIQLTADGREDLGYGRIFWSPDSRTLAAFRVEPGDRKEVHLIESSPEGGGRARLRTRGYDLPGDKLTTYELNLFDVMDRKQIKPEVDRFEHGWLSPRLRWRDDGRSFAYEQTDRGHQRFRLIEVEAGTGAVRNIIDERSDTFIWTTHTEGLGMGPVTWLNQSDEVIHVSERDGWRHLYLVDATSGEVKNRITEGEWVVRGIDRIDEDQRQIWFRASGVHPGQDPYFIHFHRVNFDGTGLVSLTEGDGTHSVEYSPDRRYLIDTYSRVDMAPVNELRRVSDGGLVCKLEEADIEDLKEDGWEPPEVFAAKGRDGETGIWGNIYWPGDLDRKRKYPVIEDIYAGPQGSFVPKTFSSRSRYEALNELGFVVVKIDGMGTANRSKAFHDVCWKNLKDGGFEDRILWMKAAAKKHSHLDLTRVGVYGNSAGGQNAAAAVLFHPEFYKVAVASCGCHDNRMDKASWNEQWMGYMPPDKIWNDDPGNWYSRSSNIDNAGRLEGKLFLIVGEMDSNVPPESTMRFVDALIKAGKDFDLLVIPGGGHGMGGAYGARRMRDFFTRHLLESPGEAGGRAVDGSGSPTGD